MLMFLRYYPAGPFMFVEKTFLLSYWIILASLSKISWSYHGVSLLLHPETSAGPSHLHLRGWLVLLWLWSFSKLYWKDWEWEWVQTPLDCEASEIITCHANPHLSFKNMNSATFFLLFWHSCLFLLPLQWERKQLWVPSEGLEPFEFYFTIF